MFTRRRLGVRMPVGYIMVLLCFALHQTQGASNENNVESNVTSWTDLQSLVSMETYRKSEPPSVTNPTLVSLAIYVLYLDPNVEKMDYTLQFYLKVSWKDQRLAFKPSNGVSSINIDIEKISDYWMPDLYFRNSIKGEFHEVPTINKLMKVNATGHVWYVSSITSTFICPMHLRKFPFDTQLCALNIESFAHTTDTLRFQWMTKPVDMKLDRIVIAEWSLKEAKGVDCTEEHVGESVPCHEIQFRLRRDYGYYILIGFVPSAVTVILSFLPFWVHVHGIPDRISMGFLMVLTTITLIIGVRSVLPKVSYLLAMDVYMGVSGLFVFCSLLVNARINHWLAVSHEIQNDKNGITTCEHDHEKAKAKRINRQSGFIFPALYAAFHVIYLLVYLT